MKSVMAIIFSVLFVFAVSSVSFAVEEKEAKPKIPAEVTKLPGAAKIRQITGSVRAVNTNAMTITVTKKMKRKVVEAVVTIDSKTNIITGKEKRTFAEVKVGDKVIVKYKEVNGKNIAQSITIKPAVTAPKEKKIEEKKGNPAEKK
jgi:uncharacterized protein YebE (UPF0316 family)